MPSGIVMWSHNPTNNTTGPYWSDVPFLTSWGLGVWWGEIGLPPSKWSTETWTGGAREMMTISSQFCHDLKNTCFFLTVSCPHGLKNRQNICIYMYLCSWDFSWDFLLWNMMIIKYYKVLWWVFCMDYVGTMYVLRIFCIGFCMFLTSPCVEPILVGRRSIAPCCTSTSSDCPTTKTETAMW